MAKGNFGPCNVITRKWEGGDVNHPADPGGLTSRGVTAARGREFRNRKGLAPKQVTKWTDAEVDEFYRSEFWDAMLCDNLEFGVDLAVYDAGVNSGPARGRKWLMSSLGGSAIDTIKRICAARLGFVQGLKIWKTFGKGWARRIAGIEVSAVSMWLAASAAPFPKEVLAAEADKAKSKAEAQAKGAASTLPAGGGAITVDAVANGGLNWWLIGGVIAVALVAAVILAIKARQNSIRSDAYEAAAS